ncbi:MAG: L,D-transpeptidase [Deltaproteobacteria bacterium]|nr:L,D-transpeptidase [Deltaproteobacteria bacterium]
MRRALPFLVCTSAVVAGFGAVASACASKNEATPAAPEAEAPEASPPPPKEEDATVADAAASRGNLTQIGATAQTSIVDIPAWPQRADKNDKKKPPKPDDDLDEHGSGGSRRLGYLRHGAVIAAYDRPVVNDDCKEGWYEVAGETKVGYVCGKAVTTDLQSPKVRLAPKQPDRDAGMPYRYGVNLSDGTPLYRKALPLEERKRYEPWLTPPKVDPAEKAEKEEKAEGASAAEGDDAEKGEKSGEKAGSKKGPADAGADAAKPKLKDFKGKGVLVRTMARGFYLGLDKEFRSSGARWWRTSFGFAVPHERIMLQQSVTKHVGSWFESDGSVVPVWWPAGDGGAEGGVVIVEAGGATGADASAGGIGVVGFLDNGFSRKIELADDDKGNKKIVWGAELPKRAAVMLDGKTETVQGQTYHHTTAGFWVRLMDLKVARPAPPADLEPNEKWIDVDLTRQALVAFEGTKPVFATLISSGRRNPGDKEHDFPTPTGTFHVREKHVTTTMDGDVAADGPYSIEDVPWVMYFQGSYALHGAFWHDAFGRVRSHGCVNMAPEDARTLFHWADPQLPTGWHGVFAKDDHAGTRIVIHEDTHERHRR